MQRRIATYGLLSVTCAALTTACGNDDNSRRMGLGGGGTSSTGNGGSGGNTTGNGGTNTGVGGGGGGADAICMGCVEMTVPFVANPDPVTGRQAQFLFRPGGTTVVDMTNAIITWRVKLGTPASEIPPEQMYLAVMVQNGMALGYAGCYGPQIPLIPDNGFENNETWVDVLTNLRDAVLASPPAAPPLQDAGVTDAGVADAGDGGTPVTPPGGPLTSRPLNCTDPEFDRSQVFQWGLYLGVSTAFVGPATVRVGLDSVIYEGATIDDAEIPDIEFTGATTEGFNWDNTYQPPAGGGSLVHRM
jgi:hypothetical protein